MPSSRSGQFVRIAEHDRQPITLTIDGATVTVLQGDTLLTAMLIHGRRLRVCEFGDGPRAGFCLMGACQDCWVSLDDGRRLRACTSLATDGMGIATGSS